MCTITKIPARYFLRSGYVLFLLSLTLFNLSAWAQAPISGTVSPTIQNIVINEPMSPITATPASGGNGVYTYQWEMSTNNSIFWQVSGETGLTFAPSWGVGQSIYLRIASTSGGITVFSNSALVSTYPALSPGTLSAANNTTIYYGQSPGLLTGTAPSGGSGSYTYQWQKLLQNGLWVNLSGETASSYWPGYLTEYTQYRRLVTAGVTAYSGIDITVIPQINQGTITPSAQNTNSGDTPASLTLAAATGGNGTFSYQWEMSADNGIFWSVSGATGLNYSPDPQTQTYYYRRAATSDGVTVFSTSAVVNIYPPLTAGTISSNQTINPNTAPAALTGTTPTGGSGGYAYQWQSSPNNSTWANISGATAATFSPPPLTVTTYYRRNVSSNGQTVSSASVAITIASCLLLNSVPSANQNYIVTTTTLKTGVVPGSPSLSVCDVMQTIEYIDGLGRPLQTVQVRGSGDGLKDIVQPIAYDYLGRESVKYLPYVDGANDGSYRQNGTTDVVNYYQSAPAGQYSGFNTPFAKTTFESSPLNRVTELAAPGNAWQPRSEGGHSSLVGYAANTDQLGTYPARNYSAELTQANDYHRILQDNGFWAANQLYVKIVRDENWVSGKTGSTEEYLDKGGHTVLKRKWLNNTICLSTYYVYDDDENLTYVITPKAEGDGGGISQQTLDKLCYQYFYDQRQRLIEKKLPGKGSEYMVYNRRDQVVFSQNVLQNTNNQWAFSKFDELGRHVITGIYSRIVDRATLQYEVDNSAQQLEYPDNNSITGYSNQSLPQSDISYYQLITYYDSYSIPGISATYNASVATSTHTNSLVTGTKTFLSDGSASYLTVFYYDDYGRAIESVKQNHLGGIDRIKNTFNNITGEILTSSRNHQSIYDQVTITNEFGYDHIGRKKYVKQDINGNSPIVIASYSYSETGRLLTKNLGNFADYYSTNFSQSNFLQSISYLYNERGWIKRASSGLFDMLFKYEDGNSPQYNGNISGQNWGALNNRTKNFAYTYDALDRLQSGVSDQGYSESISSYDKNGNIEHLSRTGRENGTQHYAYDGNLLTGVSSMRTSNFSYDASGNIKSDSYRNITDIQYNYLNLPTSIVAGSTLTYLYDATGKKLRKASNITGITNDYIDGIHYNLINSIYQIDYIETEEGRAIKTGSSYSYQFVLKDNLGNNRVTFYRNPTTLNVQQLEATDYYPFGWASNSAPKDNKNLFNGKENQEELSEYDYGARLYDPIIARWAIIDPMAEVNRSYSPYAYTDNNPVRFIDVDGMFKWEDINFNFGWSSNGGFSFSVGSSKVPALSTGASWDGRGNFNVAGYNFKSNDDASLNLSPNASSANRRGDPHAAELAKYGKIVAVSGINVQFSMIAGDAVEIGEVVTDKGWHQSYKTYYHGVIGFPTYTTSMLYIRSKNATFSDWGGAFKGASIGLGVISLEWGTSSAYTVWGLGFGYSWGPKKFNGVSGGAQIGVTVLNGPPYYKPYAYGTSAYSHSYFSELYGN